ncbi:MAG: AraC family transcriptional regulator [Pseudomonadota bacterium]
MTEGEAMRRRELTTNQAPERIRVHTLPWLEGVEFWSIWQSTRRWSMHHDTFTAALFSSGSGSLEAKWHSRGCERIAKASSVQLMEPGEVHCTLQVSEPVNLFMVCWSPAALRRAAMGAGFGAPACFRRPQLDDAELAIALQRLQSSVCLPDGDAALRLAYRECMSRLLHLASQATADADSRPCHHPRARRAVQYLHDVSPRGVPLDVLARQANLSKYHLARTFRAMTGLAPYQYQKLLRLQSARRLLEAGTSVEEAAHQVGFADAPHLTRAFRAWLGVSPGAWARGRLPRGSLGRPPGQLRPSPLALSFDLRSCVGE